MKKTSKSSKTLNKYLYITIAVTVFVGLALFLIPSKETRDRELANETSEVSKLPEDRVEKILSTVGNKLEIDFAYKQAVVIGSSEEGKTMYYVGKSISGTDIGAEELKFIEEYLQKEGLSKVSKGEVGGMQTLGGVTYSDEKVICSSMGGIYAANFNAQTSAFSLSCAYIKDGSLTYPADL